MHFCVTRLSTPLTTQKMKSLPPKTESTATFLAHISATIGVVAGVYLASAALSTAHDGEPHEAAPALTNPATTANSGIGPSARGVRLADDSVFLPKPAQRRLGMRTQIVLTGAQNETIALAGQVIPDPGYSGVVAATEPGVLEAPTTGLPTIGRQVGKGELLAYVRPVVPSIEETRRRTKMAELQRERLVKNNELKRLDFRTGAQVDMASTSIYLDRLRSELQALTVQISELETSLERRAPLRAPIAGVLSITPGTIGTRVETGQTLFEIVDPGRLWIEAASYDAQLRDQIAAAYLPGDNAVRIPLEFVGHGLTMRDQTLPLRFRVSPGSASLRIGQTFTIMVETTARRAGIAVPGESVGRGPHGESIVWVHAAPEQFVPRTVNIVALDNNAMRILVTEGLNDNDRVVTAGAWLLAQVR